MFQFVFGTKIEGLLLKEDMWTNREKPMPITTASVGLDSVFEESDPQAQSAVKSARLDGSAKGVDSE